MLEQDQKEFLNKTIDKTFNSLFKLIDSEKIMILKFIDNKNKPQYKYRLIIKLSLFFVLLFAFTDYIDPITGLIIYIVMFFILLLFNNYLIEKIEYYDYSKIRKKRNRIKYYYVKLNLILNNHLLVDVPEDLIKIKSKLKNIKEDLKDFNLAVKKPIDIIREYKLIEILAIIVTLVLFFFSSRLFNGIFVIDLTLILRGIFIFLLAFYFFIIDVYIGTKGGFDPTSVFKKSFDKKVENKLVKYCKFLSEFVSIIILPESYRNVKIKELIKNFSKED